MYIYGSKYNNHMSYSLCCISNVLKQKSIGFATTTKKRFLELPRQEAEVMVSKRTLQNIKTTYETIKYCIQQGWNYRVSCGLFPLLSLPEANLQYEKYVDYDEIEDVLNQCSCLVRESNIRLSNHPDQFIVLASEKDTVTSNSIRELEINAWIMDKLGTQQSYQYPINLHINKTGEKQEVVDRLLNNLQKCSNSVTKRLVLENEDKGMWNVESIVECFGKYMPITYDNLHDKCNHSLITGQDAFKICFDTWKTTPLFHYSESCPNNSNKRAHAEMPSALPIDYNYNVDWEIELKGKDYAIQEFKNINIQLL